MLQKIVMVASAAFITGVVAAFTKKKIDEYEDRKIREAVDDFIAKNKELSENMRKTYMNIKFK